MRAIRLKERGYQVWTRSIPADITPKNRLLLGAPRPDIRVLSKNGGLDLSVGA